jgi:hypothetical protein
MSNNTFTRSARTLAEPFVVPYYYLTLLGVGTLVLWLVEWGINLAGGGTINTFVTLATSVAVLIFGLQPLYVAYSGQIGAILSAVNLSDPRVGVSNAVRTHFKVVLWMVFANILVGLMLSTVTFGAPLWVTVFPNLLLLVFAAIIFGYLFGVDGVDLKKKFIAGFFILVLGILAWNWVGPDNRVAIATQFKDSKEAVVGIASSGAGGVECNEDVLSVVYGTRLTVPLGCKLDIDVELVNGKFEYEFANEKLPIVGGKRLLNGKPIEAYITHSANHKGRKGYGVRFTTTNESAFREADVTYVEIIIKPKGSTALEGIDLTPAR